MLQILDVLAPIFALIGLGAVTEQRAWLGPGALDALNRFVLRIALPAELFHLTIGLSLPDLDHPGFALAYGTAMLATSAIAFALDWRRPVDRTHRLSGATIEALAAGYANTAFIGIPICLGVFGAQASAAITLSTLLVVCVLFALGIFLVELEGQDGGGRTAVVLRVGGTLLRNPIIFAPLTGLALNAASTLLALQRSGSSPLLASATTFVDLLAASATPCALLTIGMFLAATRQQSASRVAVWRVTALKLVVQPGLTVAAAWLCALPAVWTHEAVVLAALPTGTGPFMLARLYRREAAVASRVTLYSTVLSAFTLGAMLYAIERIGS